MWAGVRVVKADRSTAVKAVEVAQDQIGYALDVVQGKTKLKSAHSEIRTGYKLLKRTENGFRSVWDDSEWRLGKTRVEAATPDHGGGFYYYVSVEEALQAAHENDVFGDAREYQRLAVVEVKASGKHYSYLTRFGTKLCATKLRPIREVASTL